LIRVKTRVKEMYDPTWRVGSCGSRVIKIINTDPIREVDSSQLTRVDSYLSEHYSC
jgi:hypothetical protein